MPRKEVADGETVELFEAEEAGQSYYITVENGPIRYSRNESTARIGPLIDSDRPGELTAGDAGERLYVFAENAATVEYERQGWFINLFGREVVRVSEINITFDSVSTNGSLTNGQSITLNVAGRPNVMVFWKNINADGTLETELSTDDSSYWPFEDLDTDGEGFAQLPFVSDNYMRVTSNGFDGDVRVSASR